MNPRPDFKKSVKEFYDAVSAVENATDPSTLSALERAGVGKMRTLQTAASYVGYDLRAAVEKAKARFREDLGKPVGKPVENSQQSVEKSVPQTVQSVKKSEMEFHPEQDGGTVTLEYKGTVPKKGTTTKKTAKKKEK